MMRRASGRTKDIPGTCIVGPSKDHRGTTRGGSVGLRRNTMGGSLRYRFFAGESSPQPAILKRGDTVGARTVSGGCEPQVQLFDRLSAAVPCGFKRQFSPRNPTCRAESRQPQSQTARLPVDSPGLPHPAKPKRVVAVPDNRCGFISRDV